MTLEKATKEIDHYQMAADYKKNWIEQAKEDYQFVVGDQWETDDKEKLKSAGKPALTLNKIQPLIFLISGIQRQNRSDFKAFPIGEEDSIKAEAITYLLKDMVRFCDGDYKLSEAFEDGIICGEGWIEPWVDYGSDLINGDMKLRKRIPTTILVDPASKEYDHSDARFVIVETPNITLDQLLQLYPEKEDELKSITIETKEFTSEEGGTITENDPDYPDVGEQRPGETVGSEAAEQLPYKMLEYHYYKNEARFLLVNPFDEENDVTIFEEESDAKDAREEILEVMGSQVDETGAPVNFDEDMAKSIQIVKRFIPIPNVKIIVNEMLLDEFQSTYYPRYKKIPVFSFLAHWIQAPIENKHLLCQGIVNSLKDPQREINKRRSQELHHLNSSTNSGWLSKKKGGITNKSEVEKYGSSSGFVVEYDKEMPQRIHPAPLSSGHEQLAQLSNQDIKEISGINTELLAASDKSSTSGRAIHLRQQQGLMMIQRILDNFSRTKRELGRFLLSMISEVYDIEKAQKAVGQSWINKHFKTPILKPRMNPQDGQPMMNADGEPEMIPQMDENGQMKMELDEEGVKAFFQMILNDVDMDRYDVTVGEVATSETVKMANYTMLLEFGQQGIPIPPQVLIDESLLGAETKEKIKKSIQAAQQSAAAAQQKPK